VFAGNLDAANHNECGIEFLKENVLRQLHGSESDRIRQECSGWKFIGNASHMLIVLLCSSNKDQVSKLEQAMEFVSSGRYTVQVRT